MSTVRVLFVAADPLSAPANGTRPRLQLDEEVRQIRMNVRAADHREQVSFDARPAARTDDLLQALNEMSPHVVHFSGHGGNDGLVLVGKDGKPHAVGAAALRRLFTTFRGDIRVVVLNACFSRPQAQAIADVVGCAIGTRGQISDTAAITFGASFYRAIAFGRSVQAAYDQAATALALDHVDDRECPELVVRDGVDPATLVLIPEGGGNGSPVPALPQALPSMPPAAPADGDAGTGAAAYRLANAASLPPQPCPAWSGLKRLGGTAAAVLVLGGGSVLGIQLLDRGFVGDPPRLAAPVGAGTRVARGPGGVPSGDAVAPVPLRKTSRLVDAAPGHPPGTVADVVRARVLYENREFAAAFPVFQGAAAAGNAEAMAYLGIMHVNGEGTARAPERGVPWLRRSAAAGNARGLNALGYAYQAGIGGVTRDYREAMRLYQEAQARGFAKAMNNIGELYRHGWGVERDYGAALQWYRKAADAGDLDGMTNLGDMYGEGLGVGPDTVTAVQWFRNAVNAGSLRAMVNLGRISEQQRQYDEARSLYLRAANGGSGAAMNNLGTMYHDGRGVPRNRGEAIRWFQLAARAGNPDAAANLRSLASAARQGPRPP